MKKLKLFFACLLMAVLSIGQVWAAEETVTLSSGSFSTDHITWSAASGNITISQLKGNSSTAVNSSYVSAPRVYKGHVLSFIAADGYKINSIEITVSGTYYGNSMTAGTVMAGNTVTDNTDDVDRTWTSTSGGKHTVSAHAAAGLSEIYIQNVASATNTQLRFTALKITYTSTSSTPALSVSPASWDFGTVHASAEASKVFSVSGSNLTAGDLTLTVPAGFSVSPSSIAVDGTLAATNVTVSKNTSTEDDYAGNLEITGGGLENAKTVALTMTVDADPAPTGTFEPFSGDIEEGDYLIVADGAGMNTTVSSNRLQYTALTLTGENYVNPDESVIWHIAASATVGYWTIYSGAESKYAAATGSNNQAQMLESGTDNKSLWEITHSEAVYTITNKSNSRFLKKNGTYGFGCYADGTVSLYKKVDGAVKPSAGLAFDAAQKLAKVDGTLTAPNLSTADGFDGTVTYASSDEAVVKVNASTGAITEIVAAGKAVITAHSDATENFKEGSASYTIFVAEQAGTNEDPLTEASAKALIDLGCTLNAHVAGVVASQDGGNFTVTLTNGFKFYKAKDIGNVAFESAYLKINDEVTAYGQLTKYSSTYELAEGCYLTNYVEYTEPLTPIANDKDHPYTVAQALAFAAAPATYDITEAIYIAGVVYKVDNFSSTNGTLNIYVKDAGVENQFEFYKCKGIYDESLTAFTAEDDVQVGDEVIGYGVMKHFTNATTDIWEFDDTKTGDYLVSLDRPAVAVTGVTVESTASVAIGGHVTLHASVEPSTATNKTIVWSVQSGSDKASVADGVVTGIAEGTAVIRAASDEDASIYAECTVTVAPLSPWATTYTSNVAMAHTGSGVDNGTITIGTDDPYILVKAGASSSTGTIVVTVPKGTTDLHFHAFAWGGKTAKIELAGVENASVSEFDLAGEAGASGSGNDFTLQGDPVDQYFHVSFDAVAAETEITFSKATGSADNRFFFYGVNQEGGLILESISVSGTATALEYNEGDHFSPAGLGVTGHYSDASTAPITEGIVWAFDPDPLTEGTESVSVTATAGSFTSAAFVVDGLTVAGAAPLSPWASVYTSNVEIASNTAAHVTINEENFDAAKTSKGASATITLPQGVTTIHLHLVAWSGEAQTVSVTGDCFNEAKELTIVANAGVSGSGTTYDLGESGTDYYFSLTPDNEVAANTVITIAAASGKRFVLFGVNQEGGVLPVLESIEISGDLSTKTGYKVGDALDLDGLTVEATYSIGGVAQTPVDITNKLGDGLTLTYDPLVENQTEVTITASYEGKTDDITITGLEVASADPKIYVSTLNVNFASVEVGESVPAAETVTVTLTNVASVTATLGGTNPEAFDIDKDALTASGDITISILANTDAAATYSATLTISDNATENPAQSKTVNLSFAVTAPVVNDEYELVSDVTSLAAGDQIIIVAENAGDYYTLDGSITSQYFPSTAVSISAGIITAPSTSAIILGKDDDNWTMSMGGQLIGATAAKKASLGNGSASNTWTIAIAENVATITNTTITYGSLQFNYNNGSNSRFLNYTSAQTAVAIYKKVTPEPAWVEVRTGLEVNRHYTVCLEKNITNIDGATFWNLRYKNASDTEVYLESVDAPEAGKPYIIQATKATLKVVYGEETAVAPVDNGALRGSFDGLDVDEFAALTGTIYILKDNAIRPRTDGNFVGDHRAYILYSELIVGEPAPQPGRQIRKMPMAPQVATGIDALNVSDKPVKMVIDGQLFIIRGEKMYDATGHLVR